MEEKNAHTFSKVAGCEVCKFTMSITPPWVFFTFLKVHNWYQIAQSIHKSFYLNGEKKPELI